MRVVLTIFLATLLGGGGVYAWQYYGGFAGEKGTAVAFIDAYGNYAEVAEYVETLVHVPGGDGNTDRRELLELLNTILTTPMDADARSSLARVAFGHLDSLNREVTAAHAAQAKLYASLQDFDNVARTFRGIEVRRQADQIVQVARKRAELSARITSILTETNEQTYAIITRILAEQGELSAEHITAINDATTYAENRFSSLESLYQELIAARQEIDRLFARFTEDVL